MGRGKTSAAIAYMNEHKDTKRFLYVTPFLGEVGRVCEACELTQPDGGSGAKSSSLYHMLCAGKNIATTHALFSLGMINDEVIDLIARQHYTLIMDETFNCIEHIPFCQTDQNIVLDGGLFVEEDDGRLVCGHSDYKGRYTDLARLAQAGCLYRIDTAWFKVANPRLFQAFDEVFVLTYMFDAQNMRAYFDVFQFPYRIVGVATGESGTRFSDSADVPPPVDWHSLIHVEDPMLFEAPGSVHPLSMSWFEKAFRAEREHKAAVKRGEKLERSKRTGSKRFWKYTEAEKRYALCKEIKKVRNSLRQFLSAAEFDARMWTTYKTAKEGLMYRGNVCKTSFVSISARATNDYRYKTQLAYMADRQPDPNIVKFFARKNISINKDRYALSELLQWVWRSAVRDGKPINLYLPSPRMHKLFTDWLDDISQEHAA